MKRAVILHGTDGTPEGNWFPWLKAKLEAAGYQVWVPDLPENHTPNREAYDNRVLGGRELTDAILVGHSSGAVEVLNLLVNPRCPHVRLGVMVSAWPTGWRSCTAHATPTVRSEPPNRWQKISMRPSP